MSVPDARAIERALAAGGHGGVAVHAFEELASTNAWLVARAPGADPGPALCVAHAQVRGAGRRGRTWSSRPGDVTFSVRRRFDSAPARIAPLGLVTGVAVARALRASTAMEVELKWPNDLLLGGSKLGGLLIESRPATRPGAPSGASGTVAVGGVGINLIGPGERPDGTRVAALGDHGIAPESRDGLVADIAAGVLDAWTRFDGGGWSVFEEDWRALDALEGRAVRVHAGVLPGRAGGGEGAPGGDAPGDGSDDGPDRFDGIARGVDGGGALRVERADGRTVTVHAGEVSVRPRA